MICTLDRIAVIASLPMQAGIREIKVIELEGQATRM